MGDSIRTGIVDVGISNVSKVTSIENGVTIEIGPDSSIYRPEIPSVDLLLAVPRPHKLEKILPVISCLGVRNVFLVGAKKVESTYFGKLSMINYVSIFHTETSTYIGSHLLTNSEKMASLLVEGLSQAEVDCNLPKVRVYRHLQDMFAAQDMHVIPTSTFKVVAHPPLQEYNAQKAIRSKIQTDLESFSEETSASNEASGVKHQYVKSPDSLRFSEYLNQLLKDLIDARINNSSSKIIDLNDASIRASASCNTRESTSCSGESPTILVAVGPEGGWTEEEVAKLQQRGFQLVNLGSRILRTDIAVCSTNCIVCALNSIMTLL